MKHEHEQADFRTAVRRACELLGGQKELAQACGEKRQTIWETLNRKQKMPAPLAVKIVDATGGQVSIKDLLPDVYQRVEAELGERVALP